MNVRFTTVIFMDNNRSFIIKGDIIYPENKTSMHTCEDSYLVCLDGKIEGVYSEIPEEYKSMSLCDYSHRLIIPGMIDCHVHASQYAYRGLGMDYELMEWLQINTFPEESRFKNIGHAKEAYEKFVDDLKHSDITRSVIFATIHNEATDLLMDMLEESGQCAYVGKLNIDRNATDYYVEESAEASATNTIEWIDNCERKTKEGRNNVLPIITPRFVPTCSDELLEKLGKIAAEYRIPVQSHLSENVDEIAFVKELCPWSDYYGQVYDRFGLFGGDIKTVMAHCIYSSDEEVELMKRNGVFICHCPQSNMNVASGIAPIRKYLDKDLKLCLGTDTAGGFSLSIRRAMADAIQVSKLYYSVKDRNSKPVKLEEAFYMATLGGGEFFGKVGSFKKGYAADIIILDDSKLDSPYDKSLRDRFERAVYISEACDIVGKFINGKRII